MDVLKRFAVGAVYPVVVLIIIGIFWIAQLSGLKAMDSIYNGLILMFPLVVSIGIAIGMSKDQSGAAALAGAVGWLVYGAVVVSLNYPKDGAFNPTTMSANFNFLSGIYMGITAGLLYNRFYNIRLPEWLAFFGGRRFVPIITAVVALFIGAFVAAIF
ncbi:PTS transporter subunit EIIC [Listeria booriae]|uniref:PTS transporter subunit EIIC n=1 Tax=Listeria booriae TaxID=1552123 RepID=A0A7X0TKG0_9LIST|nr:PTS transporter subunit EIIC [Listeria booriae]MBC1210156.1 PTS transporter subunit EIIC [Listeria booriae]MBC1225779.1 PTS transporter subunit EIIC [Listeria booriae]MBC1229412.1 PTS transporter subunit EIIC [Listeria booriae]MBC1232454.1 PTS transporter subunit EIIC [Listeria booriae]MBC1246559.1 PTS transporter subunit EIIC [Listeria booriae]